MQTRAKTQQMAAEGNTLVPLKKFTGYNDVAPAVWLEKYAIFANSKGWNPQQTLNNVGLYLGDGPYTWYRSLSAATKQNLALLQAAFNEKYIQHDGVTWALRAQLSERRQTDNETVEDFAEDIERRCGQLQINGQQMVEAFVRGLRPNIRAAVIRDQPANLTAAINSARVAQSLSASEHVGVADTVKSAIAEQLRLVKEEIAALTANVTTAIPSDVGERQQQQQRQQQWHTRQDLNMQRRQHQNQSWQRPPWQQRQPLRQQQPWHHQQQPWQQQNQPWQQRRRQQSYCDRCGRSGHAPDNCFARNVQCHYCGKLGHLIRVCRAKRMN